MPSDKNDFVYRTYTIEELMKLWYSSRNNLHSVMAADEMMRRIHVGDVVVAKRKEKL